MRLIKALGAAIVLAVVLVGPPWALVRFIGNPWPAEGVDLAAPLTNNAIVGLLAVIVWVLWLQLVACIIVEAIAALTNDRVRVRVPFALAVQQHFARRLVTALVLVTVSAPITANTAALAVNTPGTTTEQPTSSLAVADDHHQQARPQSQDIDNEKTPAGRERVDHGHTTVTVVRLDSLWSIADRVLGDGDRWPEIAAMNEGRTMNDGTKFLSADHIKPGWELRVPAGGEVKQDKQLVEHQVVVEKGDTLSQIALEELGDANAYPEIVEASKNITQPGGRLLVDPDAIDVGWTIQIPGQPAPAEEKPDPKPDVVGPPADHEPGDQTPPVGVTPTPPVTENPSTPEAGVTEDAQPDATATGDQAGDVDQDETGWPVRTIGGICALLAGALVGLIALRRGRQRRRRLPGAQLPLPPAEAGEVEQEIRAVADELGVDTVDVALRAVASHFDQTGAPRPQLRLARLTADQLDLYFADDVTLPTPWESTSDPSVWILSAEAAGELEPPEDIEAPYPALVSIGHDVEDGVILLNLAHAGTFGLTGEPYVRDAFTAIALELGAAPWSTKLSLTAVGALEELPEVLEPGRLRYVPAVGGPADPDGVLAKLSGLAADHLTSVVLDAGRVISRDQHDDLRRRGAVVVTNGWTAGDSALEVTGADTARLLPYQLEMVPQLVDQRAYAGVLEVLHTSLLDPAEANDHGASGPGERVVPFDDVPPTADPPDAHTESHLEVSAHVNGHAEQAPEDIQDVDDVEGVAGRGVDRGQEDAAAAVQPQLAPAGGGFQFLEELAAAEDDELSQDVPAAVATAKVAAVETLNSSSSGAGVTDRLLGDTAAVNGAASTNGTAHAGEGDVPPAAAAELQDLVDKDLVDEPPDIPVAQEPPASGSESLESHEAPDGAPEAAQGVLEAPESYATATEELPPLLRTGHPVIRLLGPVVDIVGAASKAPSSETHQKICTRIAAYLALNPTASRPTLTQAVWGGQRISAQTVDSRISNLRAWLGTDDATGEKYLPPRTLRFSDQVVTDWQVFKELAGPKPSAAPTSSLEEALSLVRDRPLEGEESKHYGFAEYALSDMVDTIVDAAYELARRRYFEGSWRKAGQAASQGVLLDPGNERLWRIRIHAAHSAGNPAEVTEAIDRMHARVSELGFELEEETTELLQALAQHDTETIAQARKAL